MITIKPFGGLANRMRALDSSYALAKEFGRPIHLIWEKSFELNCSFDHLFELPKNVTYDEYDIGRKQLALKNRMTKALRKIGLFLPRGYDHYLFNDEIIVLENQGFNFEELKKFRRIYINTVEHFYKSEPLFSIFTPIEKLQKIINGHTQRFSENTIGIHIRRTDNANSVKFSPLSGFMELMDREIEKSGSTKFFLATDSPETAKEIKNRYGERILLHEKVLDRNLEKGIQDALIDIYCLSKCKKILGSYYSSFSEVASQINNIPLEQVYKTSNTK